MSLQGPVLIVAAGMQTDVVARTRDVGAFPMLPVSPDEARDAIDTVQPAAIILAGDAVDNGPLIDRLARDAQADRPFIPVIALGGGGAHAFILPLESTCSAVRLAALLRATLRVRTLHASVLRRAAALRGKSAVEIPFPQGDPLDDATVVVAGRGGGYPALTTAIGERVGLIGAFSLEAAAGYLGSRDVDALVVGDGFGRAACLELLDSLSADPRFRHLPVVISGYAPTPADHDRLPYLHRVDTGPADVVARVLPYARLHAFFARLKRIVMALDAGGAIDPETGLYTREMFVRDFASAVGEAEARGVALAIARFSIDDFAEARASKDAARLVGRLVRAGDFACRDRDGTILVAFSETDLGTANVVARRIASVLKHTVLAPGSTRNGVVPTVTLAGLRTRDTPASLLARVTPARQEAPAAVVTQSG